MAYIGDSQKQIVNIAPVTLDTSKVSVEDIPALDKIQENIQNNLNRLAEKQQEIARALAELSSTVTRRTEAVDQVVNGQIEFPSFVDDAAEHTGNINVSYVDIYHSAQDTNGAIVDTNGFLITHNLGRIPSGWLVVNSTSPFDTYSAFGAVVGATTLTDMVCTGDGSYGEQPIDAGNSWYTATSAAGTTISGGAATAGANGWTANGVVAGDQIRMRAHFLSAGGVTGATTAGSGAVAGVGTSFLSYAVGWKFRYRSGATGNDTAWHTITAITSNTAMTVSPVMGPNHSGAALVFEVMAFDQSWLTITAVTPGAPETLTVSTATAVTTGGGGAGAWSAGRYVIRRPMTSTQAWFRCMTPAFDMPLVCRVMFF